MKERTEPYSTEKKIQRVVRKSSLFGMTILIWSVALPMFLVSLALTKNIIVPLVVLFLAVMATFLTWQNNNKYTYNSKFSPNKEIDEIKQEIVNLSKKVKEKIEQKNGDNEILKKELKDLNGRLAALEMQTSYEKSIALNLAKKNEEK